jgi:predicted secreted protein
VATAAAARVEKLALLVQQMQLPILAAVVAVPPGNKQVGHLEALAL